MSRSPSSRGLSANRLVLWICNNSLFLARLVGGRKTFLFKNRLPTNQNRGEGLGAAVGRRNWRRTCRRRQGFSNHSESATMNAFQGGKHAVLKDNDRIEIEGP